MISTCPVCGADAERFLVRERVPANQNVLLTSRERARNVATGTLSLHACIACGFVFNAAFRDELLDYGASYENTQTASDAFAHYQAEQVARVIDGCGSSLTTVVEVGCGKGVFLSQLVDAARGSAGYGFDTSYEGPETERDGRLRFFRHYFGPGFVRSPIDAVICRHVIEHIPAPISFLGSIRNVLDTAATKVFFETPCVDWILDRRVIWDFFYEHCSYFNARSLARAFAHAGFDVSGVRHVFDGQYLWLEASPGAIRRPPASDEGAVLAACRGFADAQQSSVASWLDRLTAMRHDGKIAIWGAGAKGVTFAGLVDSEADLIDCVVDVNPRKQGCFVPGTGHEIIGPHSLASRNVRTAVLMNPNYRRENESLLQRLGADVTLID
ncbi:MAG: class I SAM-dependent methyltransferase [Candidatus Eremiobacterales bacterium]|jgi:SAM-dependent methyltransferase